MVGAPKITIRRILPSDQGDWRRLWDGYNAFYGRSGDTALPEPITEATWARFFEASEPVYALVAEQAGQVVGWRTTCSTAAPRA